MHKQNKIRSTDRSEALSPFWNIRQAKNRKHFVFFFRINFLNHILQMRRRKLAYQRQIAAYGVVDLLISYGQKTTIISFDAFPTERLPLQCTLSFSISSLISPPPPHLYAFQLYIAKLVSDIHPRIAVIRIHTHSSPSMWSKLWLEKIGARLAGPATSTDETEIIFNRYLLEG